MTDEKLIKVVVTWKPTRGLDRIETCMDQIEVFATEDRDEMLRLIVDAEVVLVGTFDSQILAAANRLRWVHALGAGVEGYLFPQFVESPIPLTCGKGGFDISGAEHAIAAMLAFAYRLNHYIGQQARRGSFEWVEPHELKGQTIGIIGLGNIGRELARKARCFQMRVIGMTRQPHDLPSYVDELLLPDQLPRLLSAADFVVVTVPNTPQTHGLIGEPELRQMKPTAYLIDISGREQLYDREALIRALQEGWIAGADLQVNTELEPDSPLWELDNLIISQFSANSKEEYDRCVDRFCENLRRYRQGQPLLGLVDKLAGY